jgi:hypothetical protein
MRADVLNPVEPDPHVGAYLVAAAHRPTSFQGMESLELEAVFRYS